MTLTFIRQYSSMVILIMLAGMSDAATVSAVNLPPVSSTEGYVACLLINEVPFPGERGYRSEEDTLAAMNQLLMVLDRRLEKIPPRYTQVEIASVSADDIIDVVTAGGVKGQFDGFYRDSSGRPAMASRITERINNLIRIADKGQPGKFARLLNYAGQISSEYVHSKTDPTDLHSDVKIAQGATATGGAYSWMTDEVRFHPGGNFLRIDDSDHGSLGGNRFFTLRKDPK